MRRISTAVASQTPWMANCGMPGLTVTSARIHLKTLDERVQHLADVVHAFRESRTGAPSSPNQGLVCASRGDGDGRRACHDERRPYLPVVVASRANSLECAEEALGVRVIDDAHRLPSGHGDPFSLMSYENECAADPVEPTARERPYWRGTMRTRSPVG